jgi:hypothetical protein
MNLQAARNKLSQADILYDHLRLLPSDIARDMRRRAGGNYRLGLETYFSACLNAARSSFFILARTGGPQFKDVSSRWRNDVLEQEGREQFNLMLSLRDRDVHFGEISAEVLPKMMESELHDTSPYNQYNAAIFGPRPLTEHQNPDGITVRATGLQGTYGLYIQKNGSRIDAADACALFISQLRSLLEASEAAGRSP